MPGAEHLAAFKEFLDFRSHLFGSLLPALDLRLFMVKNLLKTFLV